MTFTVITLFPSFFEGILASSMLKIAQESGKVVIRFVDIRDFGVGKHKVVDDKPYGGGRGMILKVDSGWRRNSSRPRTWQCVLRRFP